MPIETIPTPALISRHTEAGCWGTRIWPDYIDASDGGKILRRALEDDIAALLQHEGRI